MEFLRKNFSWLLLGGAIVAGCGQPPPIIIDSADSDCAWNQGGGNFNRASYISLVSSDITEPLWTRTFKRELSIEPTAVYGKILIPTTDRRLHIISNIDGSRLLEKKYKNAIVAPVIISDSLAVLLVDGEKLVVENWIIHRTIWEAELGGSFIEPLVMDGNIYWIDGKNLLRCYSLEDGVRIWDRKLDVHFSCTITGSSEGVFLAGDNGIIYCYEKSSGQPKWCYDTGSRMRNPPVLVEDHLVFCGAEGSVGRLNAADGSPVWKIDLKSPIIAPLASDGEGVYIGTNDRYIYRLDFESGDVEWRRKIGGPVKAGPTLTENLAVFVSIDYRVYFVDKINGGILYRYKTDGMLTTRPLVCDGKILIAGEDRKLYCFDITGEER